MKQGDTSDRPSIDSFHTLILGILGILWSAAFLIFGQFTNSQFTFGILGISVLLSFSLVILSQLSFYTNVKIQCLTILFLLFTFPFTATCLILEPIFEVNVEVLLNQPQLRIVLYIYFLASLFYLIEFVHLPLFLLSVALAIAIALFTQSFIQQNHFSVPFDFTIFYFSVFGWMIFWRYHNHRFKKATNKRIEELQLLSNAIAHELRTPLGAMVGIGTSLENWMPQFIELAQKAGTLPNQSREVARLTNIPSVLKRMVRSSEMAINMLVEKIKSENGRSSYNELCNSKTIIENALLTYPLTDEERQLIEFNSTNDFSFISNSEAMKHVILNLLKNALFQIQKNQRGKIQIWFETHKNKNSLHFKDTAIGIHILDLLKIFDKRVTSTSNGMGLGLLFCKLVVTHSGGTIFCDSIHGEYAEFILTFPHLPKTAS